MAFCVGAEHIHHSAERARERLNKDEEVDVNDIDAITIDEMLVFRGRTYDDLDPEYQAVLKRENFKGVMMPGRTSDKPEGIFGCRHFDEGARICTIYSRRPGMCRWYPNGRKCKHVGCTLSPQPGGELMSHPDIAKAKRKGKGKVSTPFFPEDTLKAEEPAVPRGEQRLREQQKYVEGLVDGAVRNVDQARQIQSAIRDLVNDARMAGPVS